MAKVELKAVNDVSMKTAEKSFFIEYTPISSDNLTSVRLSRYFSFDLRPGTPPGCLNSYMLAPPIDLTTTTVLVI
jgi:hypothetical protein